MSFQRPVILDSGGLAPDVYITDGHVYVAYGYSAPGVSELRLVLLDNIGNELSRKVLPGGFFNSFPRFGGPWLAYKRGDPTYGPAMVNVVTGQVETWPGIVAGNFGIAVNPFLGLVAYQNGSYPIWFGDFGGRAGDAGLQGAPDGIDSVISRSQVTLRKDTRNSVPGIYYPVRAQDVVVGECVTELAIGVQLDGDILRMALQGQNCPTPRCACDGQTYAFVTGGPDGVRLWLGPRADVQNLPPVPTTTPETVGPVSPPRAADGRFYDTQTFLLSTPDVQPRKGPTHPQHQLQIGDTLYIIKFGDIIPTGRAYELYKVQPEGLRHLEDASGSTPMHFTDTRWWPRHMQIGEQYAFKSGPHEEVWDTRDPCTVSHIDPVNRKMWLHALWDDFYWGPDLGHRATIMLVYDDTDQAELPGRYVEVGYYAAGAGWCRWEAYHAELVYPNGPQHGAVFPPSAMSSRSDFYLVGGPIMTPELTGCVSPDGPFEKPWGTTPVPPMTGDFMIDPKTVVLYKSQRPSSRTGCVNLILATDRVFSCQGDGSPGDRDPGTDGPFEQAQVTGNLATFHVWKDNVQYYYVFGIAPIDKVL